MRVSAPRDVIVYSQSFYGAVIVFVQVLALLGAWPTYADWALYEETSIAGTVSGSIRKGHIFKTRSGNIYEVVDYVYLYEYEYSPSILALRDGDSYKLIIKGFDKPLLCKCLNCKRAREKPQAPETLPTPSTIESYIVSEFSGFDHGNIYSLANGQIWEQTEYWIWVWVWVNPSVLIWNEGGVYRMKVEQIDHPVMVKRIK
jgi:hypothetical protein